jgi:hypothetical protein
MVSENQPEITFHFIKSANFQEILMEGVWGGLTPHGRIQMAIYNERQPIPKTATYEVKGNRLGGEITEERESLQGIVRNIEANVVMDLEAAEMLRSWLDDNIKRLKEIQEASKDEVDS